MARIRTIKPDFWTDDVIADLDPVAMLLYIGMWNFADDEGYIKDSVGQLRRQIFPDRGFDVAGALDQLVDRGRAIRVDSDQGRLLHLPKLLSNQKISHPTPTKYTGIRPPGAPPEPSRVFANPLEPSALRGGEGNVEERKGGGSAGAPLPPVDNSEPPTRCPTHTGTVIPPKCGQCKDARVAHEAWAKTQAIAAHPSRKPAWDPTTHCEHGQHHGKCDACDQEARHAANVIQGRFGGVA